MRTFPRHEQVCPYCGAGNDMSTETLRDRKPPKPGDVSVCAYCAGLAVFTEAGLRLPTAAELEEFNRDPAVQRAVGVVHKLIEEGRR